MERISISKIVVAVCAFVLAGSVFAGCAGTPASTLSDGQQSNRSYMSQVSEIMDQLDADFALFVDAVSRGDVVNMRTQADNAYRSLSKLDNLEVPEDLSDVGQDYRNGIAKLREALDGYIDLYTALESGSLDESTYDYRIAAIQKTYDEGIALLEKGDQEAAAKE